MVSPLFSGRFCGGGAFNGGTKSWLQRKPFTWNNVSHDFI